MTAYEAMIRATVSKEAPWYVVPADNKEIPRLRGNPGLMGPELGVLIEPMTIVAKARETERNK